MADAMAGKMNLVVSITIDRMSRSTTNMVKTFKALLNYVVGYKLGLIRILDLNGRWAGSVDSSYGEKE